MNKDYIPKNIDKFNNFQNYLNGQVITNATPWNVPAAEQTALDTWSQNYVPLYKNVSNLETRSREQVLAYNEYRTDYVAFLRPFCQGYLVNNPLIPVSERVAMGLNPRGLNPPSKRPHITTSPILKLKAMGGGLVRYSFSVEDSKSRSARQADSNGVEVFFKLLSQTPKSADAPVLVAEEDINPNNSAESGLPTEGYNTFFNTHARFTKQLALSDIGKTLHVYARWVNTSDETKNGPFSMVSATVVS
jgi:hypothetical protein